MLVYSHMLSHCYISGEIKKVCSLSPHLSHAVSHIYVMLLNQITLLHTEFVFWGKDKVETNPYLTNTGQTASYPSVRKLGTTVLRMV